MKEMLAKLYDYDCWANAIIFDHAAQLSEEEYFAPSAFGSLHHVLVHLVAVEEMWRTLTQYGALSAPPASEQTLTSLAEVRALAQEEEARFRAFFDGLTDADIAGTVDIADPRGNVYPFVVWHTLNHLLLHSMQHRTEAAAILTERGHSPGNLDFIFFVRGRRPG